MTADPASSALVGLLRRLADAGYAFVTPAPETHRRVLRRRRWLRAATLEDLFGWNLPFRLQDVDPAILALMRRGGILAEGRRLHRSRLRVAALGGRLFLHSAFPPNAADTVFFGPDSYRFADLLRAEVGPLPPVERIVDIGAGGGVGGIVAQGLQPGAALVLADVNPAALRLARINAAFAGAAAGFAEGDGLAPVAGPFDLAIANPPYIGGDSGRIYRDGGDALGAAVSIAWARAAMQRLSPGGRMVLYTGSAIVQGRDGLRAVLEDLCASNGCALRYREIDPDVFPGTLANPAYWRVERIAAVGAVLVKEA